MIINLPMLRLAILCDLGPGRPDLTFTETYQWAEVGRLEVKLLGR
jgi:hypothetical protein